MSILAELKQSTATLHLDTEKKLYADQIMNGTLSLPAYRHLLLTHFLFHAALENAMEEKSALAAGYELDTRRKTPFLWKDFQELREDSTPVVAALFSDWRPGQLLGACYVAEGSMLGGKVIEKHLRKSESLKSVPRFHFYGMYGEKTGEKWKTFSQFLTVHAQAYPDQVLEGANEAFRLFQVSADQTQKLIQP